MSLLNPPMMIVTTAVDDERAGCLVGFHAQGGIDPRRYAIWLSKANHTYRVATHAEYLIAHFLTAADHDLAELFGTLSGDEVDKFARCDWEPTKWNVPALTRCPNRVVVRRTALLDEGSDHVCLVTEPLDASGDDEFRPLRFGEVRDLDAGHGVEERPTPPTERARD
jgi:flavin reductase (DIM6/NTAB) family NADH-FMN oxidoreductase RutF